MVTPPPPEAADDAAPGDEVGLDPAVVARALAALDGGDADAVRAIRHATATTNATVPAKAAGCTDTTVARGGTLATTATVAATTRPRRRHRRHRHRRRHH